MTVTRRNFITIDLAKLISCTVDQVHGSKEQHLLRTFLHRNTEAKQPVEVSLVDVVITDDR